MKKYESFLIQLFFSVLCFSFLIPCCGEEHTEKDGNLIALINDPKDEMKTTETTADENDTPVFDITTRAGKPAINSKSTHCFFTHTP
jgi:hypothetical protein